MKIPKILTGIILSSFILLISTNLNAQLNDEDKILVLTNYLIENENMDSIKARNEAIATIYGKPKFKNLIYDDNSEMFIGEIVSERGDFSKTINFYMPKQRAFTFQEDLNNGKIKIEHAFDNDKIIIKHIELDYQDVYYPISIKEQSTLTIKLGAYFIADQNTEILARQDGVGAIINLQEFLKMQEQTQVFRVDAKYAFNPKHTIEFSYYSLSNSNHLFVDKDFEYNGEIVNAEVALDTYFNTDVYKLNYIYTAYQTNKLDLSFRVGLHITEISTGITGDFDVNEEDESIQTESVKVTAPLPVFGLGLGYDITPNINISYTTDYFFLSYNNITGAMTDTTLALDYKYNNYIGLGVGINSTRMRLKTKVEATELQLRNETNGILGYIILGY